jgi:hypothetical protein
VQRQHERPQSLGCSVLKTAQHDAHNRRGCTAVGAGFENEAALNGGGGANVAEPQTRRRLQRVQAAREITR